MASVHNLVPSKTSKGKLSSFGSSLAQVNEDHTEGLHFPEFRNMLDVPNVLHKNLKNSGGTICSVSKNLDDVSDERIKNGIFNKAREEVLKLLNIKQNGTDDFSSVVDKDKEAKNRKETSIYALLT